MCKIYIKDFIYFTKSNENNSKIKGQEKNENMLSV